MDPLCGWLDLSTPESHSFSSWAPAADYLSNSEFSLTWQSLNDVVFRMGWAELPDCHRCKLGLEEMALCPFWDYISVLTIMCLSILHMCVIMCCPVFWQKDGVSYIASRGENVDLDVTNEGNFAI